MRKFLAHLLMLVMLTPSLACAMPLCADEVQVTTAEQPCAGHTSHHETKKENKPAKVNLIKDCMGVDLQTADIQLLQKPDIQASSVFIIATDRVSAELSLDDKISIRGPPPDWPYISQIQPSIILTTQRFRI